MLDSVAGYAGRVVKGSKRSATREKEGQVLSLAHIDNVNSTLSTRRFQ